MSTNKRITDSEQDNITTVNPAAMRNILVAAAASTLPAAARARFDHTIAKKAAMLEFINSYQLDGRMCLDDILFDLLNADPVLDYMDSEPDLVNVRRTIIFNAISAKIKAWIDSK